MKTQVILHKVIEKGIHIGRNYKLLLYILLPFMAVQISLGVYHGIPDGSAFDKVITYLEKQDFCPVLTLIKHKQEVNYMNRKEDKKLPDNENPQSDGI